jgi:hypothetical protein
MLSRCLQSVRDQEYENIRVYISVDSETAKLDAMQCCDDLSIQGELLYVEPDSSHSHFWNLYLNQLMARITDDLGYISILDNDDFLANGALNRIAPYLTGDGCIFQFLRNGRPKPNDTLMRKKEIKRGCIGGGCLVLHSKHKDVAKWDGEKAADFRFIKAVSEKVQLDFVPIVLQIAGNGGLGGR